MIPDEVLKEVLKLMAKYGIKKENMLADYPTLKWLFLSDRIPAIITDSQIEVTPICVNLEDHEIVKRLEKDFEFWKPYIESFVDKGERDRELFNFFETLCKYLGRKKEFQKILDGNKK